MEHYFLFVFMAATVIVSPGPGVTLTITNALRYGVRAAAGGILGIALGGFIVASVSATGVGLILTTSPMAFTVMKYIGAAYLVYLGIKLWRSEPITLKEGAREAPATKRHFFEAIWLQLSNPKAIFFFVAVFPQFIGSSASHLPQFFMLVGTYAALVVLIHFCYALTAHQAKEWLFSNGGGKVLNKIGGATFLLFAVFMATASM